VQHQDLAGVVVTMNPDHRLTGRWDSPAGDLTVLFSGTLSNVPPPDRPSVGHAAAQVLAALYTKDRTATFARIDGAYCAAIIDRPRDLIILVRDKLGIARAYLSRDTDRITFSDSFADLLQAQKRDFSLDLDSVHAFLAIGWVPTPHSLFHGVEKVPAGTMIQSRAGELSETIYYDVPHTPSHLIRRTPADLAQQVAEHLDASVSRGLALGGRWGSFLSGGVDSSSVVSSIARANTSFPTYFGGFAPQLNRYLPNPEEPEMSQLVANRYGTDHHTLWLEPEAVESAPRIVGALEEPVCDGGCIVLSEVMRAARSEVEGLMTGIGGDFLFTGERRHKVLNLIQYMRFLPNAAWEVLARVSGMRPFIRSTRISQVHFDLTRLLNVRKLSLPEMYAGFYLQAEHQELQSLFVPAAYAQLTRDPRQEMDQYFRNAAGIDPLAQFLYLDLKTQTPEHCAREAETLGRQNDLVIYNPFLDSEFVDFAMSVPSRDKIAGLQLKVPLRNAMRNRVPDRVLDRKKGGLGSPIRWWVTQTRGFVADALSVERIERRGLFCPAAIERFRRATASGSRDYTKLLWSLFTLELWMQRFVDRNAS
jgi:asparagine synthase (glutamine-hydrolysing)